MIVYLCTVQLHIPKSSDRPRASPLSLAWQPRFGSLFCLWSATCLCSLTVSLCYVHSSCTFAHLLQDYSHFFFRFISHSCSFNPAFLLGSSFASLMKVKMDKDSPASSENIAQTQPDHDNVVRKQSNISSKRRSSVTAAERRRRNDVAKLANPLAGISHDELEQMGDSYARKHQMGGEEDIRAFRKGACLAQDPQKFASVRDLTGQEKEVLNKEITNRWSQPKLLYLVIILCSTCAAVQGMGM